jgi:hypothetical protein
MQQGVFIYCYCYCIADPTLQGKICLIQRKRGTAFAEKVTNCVKGEGIAAIIYAR